MRGLLRGLSALMDDVRGNTLVLFAFSLLPLLGMIGGGLDISRAYLVKSRLQNACDAAVLGGRRAMSGSDFNAAARDAADRFFYLNFTRGRYNTTGLTMNYDVGNDLIVHGRAAVTMPTAIMKIFGQPTIPMTATCDAQLQLPNSDIMFVLDTTLSMTETNPGDSQTKIVALRKAVMDFYTTLNNAQSSASQVRYGFVPYSSTVNVGLLLKRDWMVDSSFYQTREFNRFFDQSNGTEGATVSTGSDYSAWSGTRVQTVTDGPTEDCTAPANENYSDTTQYGAWSPDPGTVPRSRQNVRTVNGTSYSSQRDANGVCKITKVTFTNYSQSYKETVTTNPKAGQSKGTTRVYYWKYGRYAFSTIPYKGSLASGLMAGGSVTTDRGNNNTARVINWGNASQGACIEERKTLRPLEAGTAYDLDVDLVPVAGNVDTQWRPFLPDLIWSRAVSNYYPAAPSPISGWQYNEVPDTTANYITPGSYKNDFAACPSPSRRLQTIRTPTEKDVLQTYLNALAPRGRTYHDIGMLWGLRLMSGQGLFAADNATGPNGTSIARHLIFMTDGDTETNIADYDAYGVAALDRRRTLANVLPTNAAQDTIVEDRLSRLCTVAKDQKNITVWVIAFGTSLTKLLRDCASPNRAYQANNAAALNETFADIAARISQLRVTR